MADLPFTPSIQLRICGPIASEGSSRRGGQPLYVTSGRPGQPADPEIWRSKSGMLLPIV